MLAEFARARLSKGPKAFVPVLLAMALALSAGTASAAPRTLPGQDAPVVDPGPPGDGFYTPPSPLPAGSPGDVIRARPAKAGPPRARQLADAWQVMYLSTDAKGNPIAVTGTVLVPKNADRTALPIVGFGPGTQGPAFRCAPSRMIDSGAYYEQAGLNEMLARKWAVAVPDYAGHHQDPKTTYITGKAIGPALIDAVRAAQRLQEAGLSPNAKVLFHGYSQGGGASMWAGQLQPEYAPELNLAGVVGGGVPSDVIALAIVLDNSPMFGFMLYAIKGMHNAYPELPLDEYLNDAGRAVLEKLDADDCTLELMLNYQGKGLIDYFTDSPFGEQSWIDRAQENRLGQTPINVPVYQYHSKLDEIVEYNQAAMLRDDYCRLGVRHTWKTWDDLSHITLVYRGNADAFAFMQDRLDGKPAGSTC